jgi:fatty-acyl-CoA synthase
MQGLMQDYPLTIDGIFRRVEKMYPNKTIVEAVPGEVVRRTSYGAWAERTRRLGGVLSDLGISAQGRVATFGWNTTRHMELYFAAPCSGRVLHTLNIRLFAEQITYIVNHAEDEVIFADRSLLPLLWPLMPELGTVKHVVVIDDGTGDIPDDPRIRDYETLLAEASPAEFNVTDENLASSMCYTSGTTGNPKGVVYSHRSVVLHSMATMFTGTLGVNERDRILPVVPMFHANAWGLCQGAAMAGADLIFPGRDLSAAAVTDLLINEKVTLAAGVPTIWMGTLPLLEGKEHRLRAIVCGGSAVPRALSESYRERIGLPILQAWGMTETSPLASVCQLVSTLDGRPEDELADIRATQGQPAPGVEARIVEPDTVDELAWDGKTSGELQVRGPWIARTYYNDDRAPESFTADGWLRTGDVATVTPDGYIHLVDRTKDLVKSGGEWISSVELENELMAHPKVAEAAVIAIPHERWVERPLACVVIKPGEELTKEEVLAFLEPRVAKWWLPDDVVFIDEVPKTSVGKFSKKDLRERFAGYQLP